MQKIDKVAKLSWSTEKETNSSNFIIERSIDGRTWNTISTVTAAGNSSNHIDYSVVDNSPITGLNYYRIKLVETAGKYYYSYIRSALFYASIASASVTPNPTNDFINLYLVKTGNQKATIQLMNTEGKMIYNIISAQSTLQINTKGISKGLYFVKVIDANKVTIIKVVLQ